MQQQRQWQQQQWQQQQQQWQQQQQQWQKQQQQWQQQQRQSHPLQESVSDSMPPAMITDLSKIQDKSADENQQTLEKHRVEKQRGKSYTVTQQPIDFNELDYANGIVAKNISKKKKKKRRRRCCRKSKQSDKKCCDGCGTWFRDKCSCSCSCGSCGSCGSCVSCGSCGSCGSCSC